MSQLEVDKIIPQSGTTLTIGDSGDTITFADGAVIGIDTDTLYIDSANNRVGIGTSSPSSYLADKLVVATSTSDDGITIASTGTNLTHYLMFADGTTGLDRYRGAIGYNHNDNSLRLLSDGTERIRIDSSGHVGVGTSTLPRTLNIYGASNGTIGLDNPVSGSPQIAFKQNGTDKAYVSYWDAFDTLALSDGSGNGLHFKPSTGKVGIGVTSPSALLDLGGAGSSFQSGQEKITIAQAPVPYSYYPSLSSHNRSYLHLTGSGGGSGFNTSIHGYQVENPSGGSYMRVASGLTNNAVFYHKNDVNGYHWYADYNKSSGDADYTPSPEVSFNFISSTGAIVFNESSRDRDFRVESSTNTHALFVDGGNDMLTIGGTGEGQADCFTFNYGDVGGAYLNFNMDGRASPVTGVNGAYIYSGQGSTGDYLAGNLILQSRSNNNRSIQFVTGSTPALRMTIDSSGNVLVGKTAIALATVGGELRADGQITGTRNDGSPLILNRTTSDGEIAQFYKDATKVGSIGTYAGDMIIGTTDTGLRFDDGASAYIPWNTSTNSATDGTISLGFSTVKYNNLYLSGSVYLGGTGSANALDDYEEGTFTPLFVSSGGGTASGYGTQTGRYTKIGRLVYIALRATLSNKSGLNSGSVSVGGLPFNSNSGNVGRLGVLSGEINNITSFGLGDMGGSYLGPNSTAITLMDNSQTSVLVSDLANNSSVDLQMTYEAP